MTATAQDQRQLAIQRIYLKDVSFEIPNAPETFRSEWQPENSMNINTAVNNLDAADTFEVVLNLTLTSKSKEHTLYIAEIKQAGIFTIKGFTEQERSHLLGAYCPNTLFAYAREAISTLVAKGSFPQIILQPINFDALFVQQQQKASKQAPNEEKRTLN